MNADKVFKQGATHQVCQDYAEAYASDNEAVAILADGCSSAPRAPGESWKKSEFTDWGARLNVRAAKMEISRLSVELGHVNAGVNDLLISAVARADAWRNTMQLPIYTLDSTLMLAYAKYDRWFTMVMGDGAVILGKKNGEMDVYVISFTNDAKESMPFYPSYNISAERRDGYRAEAITKNNQRSMERYLFKPDGSVTFQYGCPIEIEKADILSGDTDGVQFIALLSDGITSFRQPDPKNPRRPLPFDTIDILKVLMPFKNGTGEFVVKRHNMFEKDCRVNGYTHSDDFSLAAIYFTDEEQA